MYKISWLTPLCVEVPQVQYIDLLSEQVHVSKPVAIVTTENLNLSRIFVVSHLLSAKVYPKWRLNPGFGIQNRKRETFP